MNRNIIITGASSGIGYQTALALCKDRNNNVYALARNDKKLRQLQEEVKQLYGVELMIHAMDLSDKDELMAFSAQMREKHITIDILINNAGHLINKAFEEMTDEEVKEVYDVNLFAPVRLIREMLPGMNQTEGHVLNIGSMGGFQGSSKFSGLSIYSSSKAALANLTECLAEEYSETGLRFNCLALGAVQTEMLSKAFPDFIAPISAQEMGHFVADFALNGSKYFNGKVIPVSLGKP